jgi:glucosamine-6-phosphate isomerase
MNLHLCDSEGAWLEAVATFWRDRLRCKPSLRICLASGHTPIPIYGEMVKAAKDGGVSFERATIFALDEFGGLAPKDPGRCRNMLVRDLVKHVGIAKESFHFLNPDAPDLEAECRAYDAVIGNGFDVVLLGVGLNGHLGMNEPGSAADSPTRRVELHESTVSGSARYVTHDELPRWGLTVGMKQFFASREVWLVATGSAKAEIVARIVKGDVTDEVPASLMRRHPNCSLFLDAAAAACL